MPVLKRHDLEHTHKSIEEIIEVGNILNGAEELDSKQRIDEHEENQ